LIGSRRRSPDPNSPQDVVRLLVMVNRLRHRYHKGHSRVRTASTEFIDALTGFLRQRGRSAFRITLRNGQLVHDNTPIFEGDESVRELARLLEGLGCGGIAFRSDLTSTSVNALLDWLGGKREQPAKGTCAGIEFLGQSPMDRAATARAPFGLRELDTAFQVAAATRHTLAQIFDEVRNDHPLDSSQVHQLVRWVSGHIRQLGSAIAAPVFLSPTNDSPAGHATHVFLLSMALLRGYARDRNELERFCAATLLHDIGIACAKPTARRTAEQDRHPQEGADLLLRTPGVDPMAVEVAFTHHLIDPGEESSSVELPIQPGPVADTVHIADRIERMTGRTQGSKAVRFLDALDDLMNEPGLESKHDVVQAYLADLTPYPPGSLVRVRNDAVGVVLHVYPDSPDRPRIALVQDGAGRDLAEPVLIELLETDDADHSIAETLMRPSHSLQSKH